MLTPKGDRILVKQPKVGDVLPAWVGGPLPTTDTVCKRFAVASWMSGFQDALPPHANCVEKQGGIWTPIVSVYRSSTRSNQALNFAKTLRMPRLLYF